MNKEKFQKIKEKARLFVESFSSDDSVEGFCAEIAAFENLRKEILSSNEFTIGKPLVGQFWFLKKYKYISTKKPGGSLVVHNYNPVLIIDESKNDVEILCDRKKAWISKFYIHKPLLESNNSLKKSLLESNSEQAEMEENKK